MEIIKLKAVRGPDWEWMRTHVPERYLVCTCGECSPHWFEELTSESVFIEIGDGDFRVPELWDLIADELGRGVVAP